MGQLDGTIVSGCIGSSEQLIHYVREFVLVTPSFGDASRFIWHLKFPAFFDVGIIQNFPFIFRHDENGFTRVVCYGNGTRCHSHGLKARSVDWMQGG